LTNVYQSHRNHPRRIRAREIHAPIGRIVPVRVRALRALAARTVPAGQSLTHFGLWQVEQQLRCQAGGCVFATPEHLPALLLRRLRRTLQRKTVRVKQQKMTVIGEA
jgi:hypothetical protein